MGRRPGLWRHKSGQWATQLGGKTHYLGTSRPIALQRFRELVARHALIPAAPEAPTFLAGLIAQYREETPDAWSSGMLSALGRWGKTIALADLTADSLGEFARWITQQTYRRKGKGGKPSKPRPYSPKSVRHAVAAAARLFRWASARKWCPAQTMPRLPKAQRRRRDVPPESIAAALEKIPARARRILTFIAESGCRPSEACRLTWADVHAGERVAILAEHKTARVTGTPLLSDTPPLRELRTEAAKDRTNTTAMLANGFTLRIAWAGSAASLASDPVATVVLDEVDKYKAFTGNDGSPIDLARVRTRTYEGRYLVVALSTPTTTEGYIHQLHAASDAKLRYWMPCPRCGKRFVVGLGHLRIPQHEPGKEHESAAAVEKNRSAWLECPHCAERIDEEDRPAMIRSGAWACDSAAGSADFEMLCRERECLALLLRHLECASIESSHAHASLPVGAIFRPAASTTAVAFDNVALIRAIDRIVGIPFTTDHSPALAVAAPAISVAFWAFVLPALAAFVVGFFFSVAAAFAALVDVAVVLARRVVTASNLRMPCQQTRPRVRMRAAAFRLAHFVSSATSPCSSEQSTCKCSFQHASQYRLPHAGHRHSSLRYSVSQLTQV